MPLYYHSRAMTIRLLPALLVFFLGLSVSGCDRSSGKQPPGAEAALLISAEDVHTMRPGALASGPAITGSIQPERRADLRAELSAMVMQVLRENGDPVRRGELLVRLDDTAIRDALASAESASRAASQAFDQAGRQLDRQKTLRASGMATAQTLEDAEIRRNSTQSDLEAAKARVVSARQQLTRTEVRAPFDGVVSDRKVSAGDTAQVGKELLKVIDPASMRFEGLVSADHIGVVRAGQSVIFRVNGYGAQDFAGRVRRVNPAANATTRQVEVLVDFAGPAQPRLAGLYAEGRIETESRVGLSLPAASLVREGDKTFVWAIKGAKLAKAAIKIGERDPRSGEYEAKEGLVEGDQVLRYPSALLKDGQPVQVGAAAASAEVAKKH
jgi:membrane fusion protein, multidrug efflux system